MRKSARNVQKSDSRFLDTIKDQFKELGGRMQVSKTRTKSSFSGYDVKVNRETETVSADLDNGDSHEGE